VIETICIVNTQVPFARGGAERLVDSLARELRGRGFTVDTVALPFHWPDRVDLLKSALAWRLIDLTAAGGRKVDRVIATRFPSYAVKHPNKVVWLVHQLRQVYDLLGSRYSDFAAERPRDRRAMEMVRAIDRRTLAEARAVYTISANVADRLRRGSDLAAEVLYPPPPADGAFHPGEFGDYVFAIGRLDRLKRFDLLIRAVAAAEAPVRCRIAGTGPEEGALRDLAARLGVADRVELLGWVEDAAAADLYAGSLAVFYAPFDEDYGYVTIEAFRAGKPVVTAADAGGVLEFVEDGVTGFVCPPDAPRDMGARLDLLFRDRERARALGAAGAERVAGIGWDRVIAALTA
jgi:glycosyltransferase involved in cell wall biosynthesis